MSIQKIRSAVQKIESVENTLDQRWAIPRSEMERILMGMLYEASCLLTEVEEELIKQEKVSLI